MKGSTSGWIYLAPIDQHGFNALTWEVVKQIPPGKVSTYGRIAAFIPPPPGPRALGNRSLLADPARIDVARRLSTGVKTRASFRPYAFSVTAEHARRCMDLPAQVPLPAKWMQMVATVPDAARSAVRAAVHVDGTNRAQVCAPEDNQRFHRLLSAFGEVSGLGALLNTSFNDSGFPIVATPAEALLLFARSDLDTLVLNDALVRKVTS